MVTKSVSVTTITRDENGNPISQTSCDGVTEDDGVTVTMGIGNLPEIGDVENGDIVVRVSTVNVSNVSLVSAVEDHDAGTVTFTFA